jgi:hypothetical protein
VERKTSGQAGAGPTSYSARAGPVAEVEEPETVTW